MLNSFFQKFKMFLNPPEFIIQIRDGDAQMLKGKVPRRFLNESEELCSDNNISFARIYGVKSEYGIRLEFSSTVSRNIQQRFRNVYTTVF